MVTIDEVVRIITPIVDSSPVKRIILFGSYAKGTNTSKSDIDLVVDSHGQLRGIDFFALSAKMAQALPMEADIFELREITPSSHMREAIAREGVVIYDR